MLIDFNSLQEMTIPGMNNGTGTMTARMYNDDSYRIIPTKIHPGGSIGEHTQDSGDDRNYILSCKGKAICDGLEEELTPGVMHICPQGHKHSIVNTGDEWVSLYTQNGRIAAVSNESVGFSNLISGCRKEGIPVLPGGTAFHVKTDTACSQYA